MRIGVSTMDDNTALVWLAAIIGAVIALPAIARAIFQRGNCNCRCGDDDED